MIEEKGRRGGGAAEVLLLSPGRQTDRERHPMSVTAVDKHVGSRIRAARMKRGMTQIDLAAAIGVSKGQMDKYERAENRCVPTQLHALSRALHVHPGWFFDEFPADEGRTYEALHIRQEDDPEIQAVTALAQRIRALSTQQMRAVVAVLDQFERANDDDNDSSPRGAALG